MRLLEKRVLVTTTLGRDENGTLSDALAGILGHLRGHPYGRFFGRPEEALYGEADRFVRRLAEHLRYTEEALFPALREVEPGSACDIEGLEKDHRLLHLYARDLALQIRGGDKKRAYGVARSFLAVLLDHIQRETEGVDRFMHSLDVSDAQRLLGAFIQRSRPASETSECSNPVQRN